jgi:hypothetical protein
LLDLASVPPRMPDICDRAGEQCPGLPPVGAIIVGYLTELAGVQVDSGALPPGGIIVHAIGRISDHKVRLNPAQQFLRVFRGGAVATHETMPAKNPNIAGSRDGLAGQVRHGIWIGQPLRELRR